MTNPAPADRSENLQPPGDVKPRRSLWHVVICIFLLVAIEFVYFQTIKFDFVNCDDQQSVYENEWVRQGITARSLVWVFTSRHAENWCPLTTISHMLDCQLFGLRPGMHHLHNVVLHAISTILLFVVLWRMTDRMWPSAFVAAVFALHPLHVESVAWITERKDVLGGLFFMLSLFAYERYLFSTRRAVWYAAMLVLFTLGLLAKPIGITFPCVLLLLDYWPLNRLGWAGQESRLPRQSVAKLLIEKIPLFALVLLSCGMTLWGLGSALETRNDLSLLWRVQNALISYASYVIQTFYPVNLVVMYPRRPLSLPIGQVIGALILLLIISRVVWVWRRKCPYLLMGWLWYLGMLVPVIGFVQFGIQAEADRNVYLPQIGLAIALAWGAADLCRGRAWICGIVATVVLVLMMGLSWVQTRYWHDSDILWRRVLAYYPMHGPAHLNLGNTVYLRGKTDDAIDHYRKALQIQPENVDVYNCLGRALASKGQTKEAIDTFETAMKIKSDNEDLHNNFANVLVTSDRIDEAVKHYREAIRLRPDFAIAHYNMGIALAKQCKYAEAVKHYNKALEVKRDAPEVKLNLALLMATAPQDELRNGEKALQWAKELNRLSGGKQPEVLNVLAAAYAEAGLLPDAVTTEKSAIDFAKEQKKDSLVEEMQSRLKLYEAGKPYRQPEKPAAKAEKPAAKPSESGKTTEAKSEKAAEAVKTDAKAEKSAVKP